MTRYLGIDALKELGWCGMCLLLKQTRSNSNYFGYYTQACQEGGFIQEKKDRADVFARASYTYYIKKEDFAMSPQMSD